MAELATALEVTCPGDHQHAHMLDGASRPTERYPPRLVKVILQTLRRHMRVHAGLTLNAVEVTVGPHIDEDVPEISFDETSPSADHYRDQYTGLPLDVDGVRSARKSEIEFAVKLGAWEARPRQESYDRMGRAPFGTRWIDSNKGDEERQEYRSRLPM